MPILAEFESASSLSRNFGSPYRTGRGPSLPNTDVSSQALSRALKIYPTGGGRLGAPVTP
eukprot:scaffold47182_cov57-Phaeocystis_antarctica.AAC.4